jgi:GT2 family glycosyltransferase
MVHGEYRRFRMDGDRRVELEPGAGPRWRTKSHYDPLLERLGYAREETFYFLKRFNFVRGGTPLVRRAVFDAVGGFDEALANHGDYEMWLRIASRFPIRFLPRVVYLYRAHEGSTQERTPAVVTARCAERICRRYGIAETLQFGTRAGPPGERSGTRYEGGLHGQEGRR